MDKKENAQKSSLLCSIYGDCYDKALTEECVCMDSEYEGSGRKLVLRLFALVLLLINLAMAAIYFPPIALAIYFTNWNMELTLALIVMVIWSSFDPKVN